MWIFFFVFFVSTVSFDSLNQIFSYRSLQTSAWVLSISLVKIISNVFDFLQQRNVGEGKKFVPRGWAIGKSKERGRVAPAPPHIFLFTLNQTWKVE